MAEQTTKQVIIDVKVKQDERIKELLKQMGLVTKEVMVLDESIDELHKTMSKEKNVSQENINALVKLREERKAHTNQLRSLSREEQNLVVANTAAKNSLNALRSEYNALKVQIANLDVGGEEFQKMSQRMMELHASISKAEQSYGVFSRNVGNYKSGFSALSFQIQQVARELPSLTVSLPQFFLALSNNIPMLADEISRTKEEIKGLKANGEAFVPLGKQIFKSIWSWQTGLVVIITLITAFSKQIGNAITKMFKGKDAVDAFRKSISSLVGSVAEERAELAALFRALSLAEEGTANYLAVRNIIQDKYGSLLENEREEVKNLNNIAAAYDLISKKIIGKAIMQGFEKQLGEQSEQFGKTYQKYYDKLLPIFQQDFGTEAGIVRLNQVLTQLADGGLDAVYAGQSVDLGGLKRHGANALKNNITKVRGILVKAEKDFKPIQDEIAATTQAMQTLNDVYGVVFDSNTDPDGGSNGDDAFQRAERALELAQQLEAEELKLRRANNETTELDKIKWDEQEYKLERKHQEDMLALQLEYGQISRDEYDAELKILTTQANEFYVEQEKARKEYYEKEAEGLKKDAEKLRKDILKYNEETERAANKQKWEAYRNNVRDMVRRGVISATEGGDMIATSRTAETDTDRGIVSKYRKQSTDGELAQAWNDAEKQYEIQKAFLNAELELYADNAAKKAEIEEQLAELERKRMEGRLEQFNTYASAVGDLLSSVNNLSQSLFDAELERTKENNEEALDDLEKRHNAGLISTKQYNKEKEALDDDLAKREALIARKKAIADRALALFNVGVDTASGIMKVWAQYATNPAMAIILTALIGATAATQTAAILAEPIPKARKGGLVQGATHEAGGVLINTEDKERIIGANPAKAFPEMLNLISYLGKKGFAVPNTGYAFRSAFGGSVAQQSVDSQKQAVLIGRAVGREVAQQLKGIKIYTAVTDVRKAEKRYDRIVNAAKI